MATQLNGLRRVLQIFFVLSVSPGLPPCRRRSVLLAFRVLASFADFFAASPYALVDS